MASADNVGHVQVLIHQVAELIVRCTCWPATLLAYIPEHSYEVWPGDRVTPLLVLFGALATLLDRFGRLQRVLTTLVLDRIVGDERIAAAFDFAGTFHYSSGSSGFLLFAR
jgi:hypothetical protein